MKKATMVFWITTIIIVIFEGVLPAFTSQTEMAKEGIRHLGYPEYFGGLLAIFKVLGAIGLIIPTIKGRCKEWIYAGFAFDFVFAFLSILIVDGVSALVILPLVFMGLLALSYRSYHRLQNHLR